MSIIYLERASTIKHCMKSIANNGVAQLQPEFICEEETK